MGWLFRAAGTAWGGRARQTAGARRPGLLACLAVAFAAVCAAAATPVPPPDDGAVVLVDALMAALDESQASPAH